MVFGSKRYSNSGGDLFFFYRERWFLGQKQSNFGEEPYFALQTDFGAFGLAPPCPKIVPAPLRSQL